MDEPIFIAGERVPEGIYRQIGSSRQVVLEHEDVLPASMDGRVACYMRIPNSPNRSEIPS
jgi:hypothetical protein